MTKHARILFWVAEINLVLWLMAAGSVIGITASSADAMLQHHKYFCFAGVALAALLQHWAYYHIYKPAKDKQKQERQNKSMDCTSQ